MIATILDAATRAAGAIWQSFPEDQAISNSRIIAYLENGGKRSKSGEYVSVGTALTHSPIWACVSLIADAMSTLPIAIKERLERGARDAVDHPAYDRLRMKPGNMTTNLWLQRTMTQALLYAGSYSRIWRDRQGNLERLELGFPDRVQPYAVGSDLVAYRWTDTNGKTTNLPASEVIAISGLSISELGGMCVIDFARNTVGRYLAAEGFADDFFANGSIPAGWFTTDRALSPDYKEKFISAYRAKFAGTGDRFRAGLLEEGLKWVASGINPDDAMLIPLLELSPYDAARFFRVPPYKLAIKGVNGRASVEQENQDFATFTLLPWVTKIEAELTDKCLLESEKTYRPGGRFVDLDLDVQLRADSETRARVYLMHRQMGSMSPNEIRDREGRLPYDGGDNFDNPHTTAGGQATPAGAAGQAVTQGVTGNPARAHEGSHEARQTEPAAAPPCAESRPDVTPALEFIAREGVLRIARRLAHCADKAAREPAKFLTLIDQVADEQRQIVSEMLAPVMAAITGTPAGGDIPAAYAALIQRFEDHAYKAAECSPADLAASVSAANARLAVSYGEWILEQFRWQNKQTTPATPPATPTWSGAVSPAA